jgi:hypothetical protein
MTPYPTIRVHDRHYPGFGLEKTHTETPQAMLAMQLMTNIAIALGVPNGEDSAGRARLALMPAADVARRACDIAAAAYDQFAARGWLVPIPDRTPADV